MAEHAAAVSRGSGVRTVALKTVGRAAAIACIAVSSASAQKPAFEIPQWAFPTLPTEIPSSIRASDTTLRKLAHSDRSFTGRQLSDAVNPPDWHPESHPAAPDVVIHARKEMKYACGLCHLPDGQGRSENATIAGLPADYIRRQVADFRSGARAAAVEFSASTRMKDVAVAATDAELADAAKYFSGIHPRKQYLVVETTEVPRSYQAGGLYALRPGGGVEPLGDRMMEISDNIEHHEMRDPMETFTVYVQPGTLEKGRKVAITARADSPTRCATCHGAELRGGSTGTVGPPIAGRSPLYLLRQMVGFRMKTRNGPTSAPMQVVMKQLSLDEMIAAAAYAGSRAP
jgi:cytochrome c553